MERVMSYDSHVDSLKATELRLGLPGTEERSTNTRGNKRTVDEANESSLSETMSSVTGSTTTEDEAAPPKAKAQIVGWPPVRSYRKNVIHARKTEGEASGMLVKVSMDGAPYLRKIDLKVYEGYKELREALEILFKCFEGCNGSEYAITYEDRDGDWMLVGDVPWRMFISCCKRLRIMRGSETRGFGSNP